MPSSSLEHLRIVAESAAYLREEPGNAEARRRRDESVRRAARSHPLSEVAEAAGLSAEATLEILSAAAEEPRRWRWMGPRRGGSPGRPSPPPN